MADDGTRLYDARGDDHTVFDGRIRCRSRQVSQKLQHAPVGVDGDFAVATVHPLLDFTGHEACTLFGQGAEGVGQLKFIAFAQVVVDEHIDFTPERCAVAEVINANHRQV